MGQNKTVKLVPGEGTAQLVESITIADRSFTLKGLYAAETVGRFEVRMERKGGTLVLDSECRTGNNAFPSYAEAAAYANDFIRRNNRHAEAVR